MGLLQAYIIDCMRALQVRALQNFTDVYKKERKAGEEYLITEDISPYHILDVNEMFVKTTDITVLNKNEFCLLQNPIDEKTGKNRMGAKLLI